MQSLNIKSPTTAKLSLTPAATVKVAELIEQEEGDDLALRIGVRPGGCSGFSYEMFFDSATDSGDHVSEFEGNPIVSW